MYMIYGYCVCSFFDLTLRFSERRGSCHLPGSSRRGSRRLLGRHCLRPSQKHSRRQVVVQEPLEGGRIGQGPCSLKSIARYN